MGCGKMRRQGIEVTVFEKQRFRLRAERRLDAPRQLHRDDRIDAIVFERRARIDAFHAQLQRLGELAAQMVAKTREYVRAVGHDRCRFGGDAREQPDLCGTADERGDQCGG